MLRAIAAFELRYQLRSPVFWVGCLIFFLLTFGSITVDQVQIGSRGNVHVNAPFAILQVDGDHDAVRDVRHRRAGRQRRAARRRDRLRADHPRRPA